MSRPCLQSMPTWPEDREEHSVVQTVCFFESCAAVTDSWQYIWWVQWNGLFLETRCIVYRQQSSFDITNCGFACFSSKLKVLAWWQIIKSINAMTWYDKHCKIVKLFHVVFKYKIYFLLLWDLRVSNITKLLVLTGHIWPDQLTITKNVAGP